MKIFKQPNAFFYQLKKCYLAFFILLFAVEGRSYSKSNPVFLNAEIKSDIQKSDPNKVPFYLLNEVSTPKLEVFSLSTYLQTSSVNMSFVDNDGDGIDDSIDLDDDNDGILDTDEGVNDSPQRDTDEDNIPDYLDTDSDGDGCFDAIEGTGSLEAVDLDINGRINGSVNASGIPTVISTGQGIGSSDEAVEITIVANTVTSQTISSEDNIQFSVTADANSVVYVNGQRNTTPIDPQDLIYEWYRDGVPTSANGSSLNVNTAFGSSEYTVKVKHPSNPCGPSISANLTITFPEVLSVSTEAEPEGANLVHTVTVEAATDSKTFPFNVVDLSATVGDDYNFPGTPSFSSGVTYDANTGLITVPGNVTQFTVTINSLPDNVEEPNESYRMLIGTEQGDGTIENNDVANVLNITPDSQIEFDSSTNQVSTLTHYVNLGGLSNNSYNYNFSITAPMNQSKASALENLDFENIQFSNGVTYNSNTGIITVPANTPGFNITIKTVNNTIHEINEYYDINIEDRLNPGTFVIGEGEITDDDVYEVLTISAETENEGDILTHDIEISTISDYPQTLLVNILTNASTPTFNALDFDNALTFDNQSITYDTNTSMISIPPGIKDFKIMLESLTDGVDEVDETYDIHVGSRQSTGTINDVDLINITIGAPSVFEDIGTAQVPITIDKATAVDISVEVITVTNTAGSADFTEILTPQTFTFEVGGATTLFINIPITDDVIEENQEQFYLDGNVILGASNVVTGSVSGGLFIKDNDASVSTISTPTIAESTDTNTTSLAFNVVMSKTLPVSRNYSFNLQDITTNINSDYDAIPTFNNYVVYNAGTQTITIPPGTSGFTVFIKTLNDNLEEPDETLTLTIDGKSGTGTIQNADFPDIISISNDSQMETNSSISHTVQLSAISMNAYTYNFTVTPRTGNTFKDATANQDYDAFDNTVQFLPTGDVTYDNLAGTITVNAGVSTFTIVSNTINDNIFEGPEYYQLNIESRLSPGILVSGVGEILDDDTLEINSISTASTVEGGNLVHNVALSRVSSYQQTLGALTITPNTSTITPFTTADYDPSVSFSNGVSLDGSNNLVIPPNVQNFTVTISSIDDTDIEGEEKYELSFGTTVKGEGSITDNDSVTVSITEISIAEGSLAQIPFTLDKATPFDITVENIVTSLIPSGTNFDAADSSDFTEILGFGQTITFTAGGPQIMTVSIQITEDTTIEHLREKFRVTGNITQGNNITTSNTVQGDITILDNDALVQSITAETVPEATASQPSSLSHNVVLSRVLEAPSTYTFDIIDQTAVLGNDYDFPTFSNGVTYSGSTGTVTVPANVNNFDVIVATQDDALDELTETYRLDVGGQTNQGTIEDSNLVSITINDLNINENIGTAGVTISIDINPAQVIAVEINTQDGTAQNGADYTGITTQTITFVPNGSLTQTINIPIIDDTTNESSEDLFVNGTIVTGANNTGNNDLQAKVTILDNDSLSGILSISSPTVTEGGLLDHTITVTASSSSQTYTLNIVNDGTTAADYSGAFTFSPNTIAYNPSTGNLTVPANISTFNMRRQTNDDVLNESTESYDLQYETPNSTFITGTGTINDNDILNGIVSISSPTVTEGGILDHTITVTGSSSVQTYTLNIVNDDTSPADYSGAFTFSPNTVTYNTSTGDLIIPANISTFNMRRQTDDDALNELTESYDLQYETSSSTFVTGTGTITDNDALAGIIAISSPTVTEGGMLEHDIDVTLSANQQTYILDIVNDGTSAADYSGAYTFSVGGITYVSGILTVPANISNFTMRRQTVDDALQEATETYDLEYENPSKVIITGTGTINDNDSLDGITAITSSMVTEGDLLSHEITLVGSSVQQSYNLDLINDTTSPADYSGAYQFSVSGITYVSGILTVPPNITSFFMTRQTLNEPLNEPTESYELQFETPSNTLITATGTIIDNDNLDGITAISSPTVVEGNILQHTIAVVPSSIDQSYALQIINDGTTAADYSGAFTFDVSGVTYVSGVLTIPAGVSSFVMSRPTTDDALNESTETYDLQFVTPSNTFVTGTGTIQDNDNLNGILAISSSSVVEGGMLEHEIQVSPSTSQQTYMLQIVNDNTASDDYSGAFTFDVSGIIYVSGVLTIPANVTSFKMSRQTIDDILNEPTESYDLQFETPSNTFITATGTIQDNDNLNGITTISSPTVVEGGILEHEIQVTPSSSPQTYTLNIVNDDTSTADYSGAFIFDVSGITYVSGVITIPANVSSFVMSRQTNDDTLNENTEGYELQFETPANTFITGTGTITDNDNLDGITAISSSTVLEGLELEHTVNVMPSSSVQNYALNIVNDNTSPNDYSGAFVFSSGVTYASGMLTVPANTSSFTIRRQTIDDVIDEVTESYELQFETPASTFVTGTGSILDDERLIVSIDDVTVVEGEDEKAVITVSLNAPSAEDIILDITTQSGTADWTDYDRIQTPQQITFLAGGPTSLEVEITITDDAVIESDEDFMILGTVTSGGSNIANLTAPEATVVIEDNDELLELQILSVDVNERDGSVGVPIVFLDDKVSTNPTEIRIYTEEGYATEDDYEAIDKIVVIPAGSTGTNVSLLINDDILDEEPESFRLLGELVSGNVKTLNFDGVVNIIDDDMVNVIVSETNVVESEGIIIVKISLNTPSIEDTIIDIKTHEISASSSQDYLTFTSTVFIPAGETEAFIEIEINDDSLYEGDETFLVEANVVSGSVDIVESGEVTVIDDDSEDCMLNINDDCDGDGVTNGDELDPPGGGPATDPNNPCSYISSDITLTVTEVCNAAIDGVKIADVGDTDLGDVITYTIYIENTGTETLSSINIIDTFRGMDDTDILLRLTTEPTFVSSSLGSPEGTIQGGEIATYEATFEINQPAIDAGGVSNSVLVEILTPEGHTVSDVSDDGDDFDGNTTDDPTETQLGCTIVFNEFSPNGDGKNETFVIKCIEDYPNNRLKIYNRWGNLVYEKRGYKNTFKGASNKGKKLPSGTYYYTLNLGKGKKPKVGWLYMSGE